MKVVDGFLADDSGNLVHRYHKKIVPVKAIVSSIVDDEVRDDIKFDYGIDYYEDERKSNWFTFFGRGNTGGTIPFLKLVFDDTIKSDDEYSLVFIPNVDGFENNNDFDIRFGHLTHMYVMDNHAFDFSEILEKDKRPWQNDYTEQEQSKQTASYHGYYDLGHEYWQKNHSASFRERRFIDGEIIYENGLVKLIYLAKNLTINNSYDNSSNSSLINENGSHGPYAWINGRLDTEDRKLFEDKLEYKEIVLGRLGIYSKKQRKNIITDLSNYHLLINVKESYGLFWQNTGSTRISMFGTGEAQIYGNEITDSTYLLYHGVKKKLSTWENSYDGTRCSWFGCSYDGVPDDKTSKRTYYYNGSIATHSYCIVECLDSSTIDDGSEEQDENVIDFSTYEFKELENYSNKLKAGLIYTDVHGYMRYKIGDKYSMKKDPYFVYNSSRFDDNFDKNGSDFLCMVSVNSIQAPVPYDPEIKMIYENEGVDLSSFFISGGEMARNANYQITLMTSTADGTELDYSDKELFEDGDVKKVYELKYPFLFLDDGSGYDATVGTDYVVHAYKYDISKIYLGYYYNLGIFPITNKTKDCIPDLQDSGVTLNSSAYDQVRNYNAIYSSGIWSNAQAFLSTSSDFSDYLIKRIGISEPDESVTITTDTLVGNKEVGKIRLGHGHSKDPSTITHYNELIDPITIAGVDQDKMVNRFKMAVVSYNPNGISIFGQTFGDGINDVDIEVLGGRTDYKIAQEYTTGVGIDLTKEEKSARLFNVNHSLVGSYNDKVYLAFPTDEKGILGGSAVHRASTWLYENTIDNTSQYFERMGKAIVTVADEGSTEDDSDEDDDSLTPEEKREEFLKTHSFKTPADCGKSDYFWLEDYKNWGTYDIINSGFLGFTNTDTTKQNNKIVPVKSELILKLWNGESDWVNAYDVIGKKDLKMYPQNTFEVVYNSEGKAFNTLEEIRKLKIINRVMYSSLFFVRLKKSCNYSHYDSEFKTRQPSTVFNFYSFFGNLSRLKRYIGCPAINRSSSGELLLITHADFAPSVCFTKDTDIPANDDYFLVSMFAENKEGNVDNALHEINAVLAKFFGSGDEKGENDWINFTLEKGAIGGNISIADDHNYGFVNSDPIVESLTELDTCEMSFSANDIYLNKEEKSRNDYIVKVD